MLDVDWTEHRGLSMSGPVSWWQHRRLKGLVSGDAFEDAPQRRWSPTSTSFPTSLAAKSSPATVVWLSALNLTGFLIAFLDLCSFDSDTWTWWLSLSARLLAFHIPQNEPRSVWSSLLSIV